MNKEISMVERTLSDLFLAQLKDIYYAEKKIFRTLPKMVKAAQAPELKQAFTAHREETQGQIERLEQVFEMIGKRPQTKPCEAINGIVAEGEETIEDFGESTAIDTGLVAAGQAVEHYEMARYGALIAWAGQLDLPKAVALLNENLQEELKAERLLTQIGASKADKTAATKIAALTGEDKGWAPPWVSSRCAVNACLSSGTWAAFTILGRVRKIFFSA